MTGIRYRYTFLPIAQPQQTGSSPKKAVVPIREVEVTASDAGAENEGMNLLLLRDSRIGHFNQTLGIALAVERLETVERTVLDTRPSFFAPGDVRKLVMRRFGKDAAFWLRAMYGIHVGALTKPDLIAGSGTQTIAAGILLACFFAVPFVYSGQIDGYDTVDVALQLVHTPHAATLPGRAYTPIPCTIDAAMFSEPRPLREPADLVGADIGLLIGGTAYRRKYEISEWEALGALVVGVAERFAVNWRVSTSRRTPPIVADIFSRLEARGHVRQFIDYRVSGPGSARDIFGADAVVVTGDSMSMIAEGIAAGRPVVALKSAKVQKGYANEAIAAMVGEGGAAIVPLASVTPDEFARTLLGVRNPGRDARGIIAAAVAPLIRPSRTPSPAQDRSRPALILSSTVPPSPPAS